MQRKNLFCNNIDDLFLTIKENVLETANSYKFYFENEIIPFSVNHILESTFGKYIFKFEMQCPIIGTKKITRSHKKDFYPNSSNNEIIDSIEIKYV
jgi:hypothetical protein